MTNKEVNIMIQKLKRKIVSPEDCVKHELNRMYVAGHNHVIEHLIEELESIENESRY